jgi:hypothetical protein
VRPGKKAEKLGGDRCETRRRRKRESEARDGRTRDEGRHKTEDGSTLHTKIM